MHPDSINLQFRYSYCSLFQSSIISLWKKNSVLTKNVGTIMPKRISKHLYITELIYDSTDLHYLLMFFRILMSLLCELSSHHQSSISIFFTVFFSIAIARLCYFRGLQFNFFFLPACTSCTAVFFMNVFTIHSHCYNRHLSPLTQVVRIDENFGTSMRNQPIVSRKR